MAKNTALNLKTVRFLSEFLPFAGMIEEGICITKDAVLMRTYIVRPHDLSHAGDPLIVNAVKNLFNAFRQISSDGWTVYVDSHRIRLLDYPTFFHPNAPEITKTFERGRTALQPMFDTLLYITVCQSIADKYGAIRQLLFRNNDDKKDKQAILYDLANFKSTTDDFFNMLKTTFKDVISANSDQQLTYFHATISDTSHFVQTPECPFYLDTYLADGLFVPDSVCKYRDTFIVCATIHDFPGSTHAGMASKILSIPVEFRLCTRFIFMSFDASKKEIKTLRKTHFQKRRGIGSFLQEAVIKEGTQLEDTEALSNTADSGEALARMADGDTAYGRMATTIIVRDTDYDNAQRKIDYIKKIVNDLGFITKTETVNTPGAFLGSIPGNNNFNPRQPLISTRNFGHFFTLSVPWNGNYTNEHLRSLLDGQGEAPHIICKADNSPFFLNLNNGDVGHTLIIGPTGAGKSILLSTLAVFWLKYPSTRIIFFDKDASCYHACLNAGGTFIELNDSPDSLKLNPFGNLGDKDNPNKAEQVFASQLIADHFAHRGIPISPKDQSAIYDAIISLSSLAPELRDWSAFRNQVQDADIRSSIDPFVKGEYKHLFSPGPDEIKKTNWLTFEMGEVMKKGKPIVSFILEYLFHRIGALLDGTPTLLIVDESWIFFDNEIFAAKLKEDLKTMRKRNCYIVLATQEIQDARSSPIFSTILNACMTKILLPNHQARQSENAMLYKDLGLADGDIATLNDAQPKRDYFFFSPAGKQKFSLNLSTAELELMKPRSPQKEQ